MFLLNAIYSGVRYDVHAAFVLTAQASPDMPDILVPNAALIGLYVQTFASGESCNKVLM